MNAVLVLMGTMALGVEVGWAPARTGGLEYTIQIEPELLESLRSGEEIISDIPQEVLRDMKSVRITVGKGKLPRQMLSPTDRAPSSSTTTIPPAYAPPGYTPPGTVPPGYAPPAGTPRYPPGDPRATSAVPPADVLRGGWAAGFDASRGGSSVPPPFDPRTSVAPTSTPAGYDPRYPTNDGRYAAPPAGSPPYDASLPGRSSIQPPGPSTFGPAPMVPVDNRTTPPAGLPPRSANPNEQHATPQPTLPRLGQSEPYGYPNYQNGYPPNPNNYQPSYPQPQYPNDMQVASRGFTNTGAHDSPMSGYVQKPLANEVDARRKDQITRPEPSPSDSLAFQPIQNDEGRPWLAFTLCMLGLFTSMGGNVWMAWTTWETRRRYEALVRDQGNRRRIEVARV